MSMNRILNRIMPVSLLFLGLVGCEPAVTCEVVNLEDQRSIYTFAQEKYQRYHAPCFYGKDLKVKGLLVVDDYFATIYLTDNPENIKGETLRLGVSFGWEHLDAGESKFLSEGERPQYEFLSGKTVEINGQLVAMIMIAPKLIKEIK